MSKELKEFIQARPELADMPQEEVVFLFNEYNESVVIVDDYDYFNSDINWDL